MQYNKEIENIIKIKQDNINNLQQELNNIKTTGCLMNGFEDIYNERIDNITNNIEVLKNEIIALKNKDYLGQDLKHIYNKYENENNFTRLIYRIIKLNPISFYDLCDTMNKMDIYFTNKDIKKALSILFNKKYITSENKTGSWATKKQCNKVTYNFKIYKAIK